jgi:hypothetical protein
MNDETRRAPRWPAILALLAIGPVGFLFAHGCGSVTNDRDSAISAAATDACNRYQACGDISATGSYMSIADCQTDWKAKFTNQWPANECEGRIDQSMLGVCRSRIMSTSCTNVLDVLTTFEVYCSAAAVCDLPSDGGRG